ncbi:MAG: N-acetyltransferase family protein [Candidatus Sericytochromatia bacterium]
MNGDVPVLIRPASHADLEALAEIYNHYVFHSHATFDTEPLQFEARQRWLNKYAKTGPYRLWLAERGHQILGFASSNPYRDHPAFCQTVETSIYLAPTCQGQGVGSALYTRLFESLADQGLHRAIAGIALPNPASVALHQKFGFSEVGTFDEYACKNGVFISSIWMQKKF